MKLLISLSYYAPHISGLTLSVKRLAELMASSGDTVAVLTSQHNKHLARHEKINSISVTRVPYLFRISKGFVMPSFFAYAYHAIKRADTVLIVLPEAEGALVAFLAKLIGKRVVCLYICEVTLQNGLMGKFVTALLRMLNRLALHFADEIITLSDDFAKHNDVLKHKKVHGIYPVVIPPKIAISEVNVLKNKLPQKKYYIGYLGRIASEKGISYLLEAIPLLQKSLGDDFVIVLAGPEKTVGEEAYQKKIDALLQKYADFVVQLGELSEDQLGAFYSLLAVFVLPSLNNTEAFGMVQVEAMYCGTPVVSTDLPGVRVPVTQTKMGETVKPESSEALAEAIGRILQNKQKYMKPVEEIKEIFSVEEIVKMYQEVLK